MLEQLEQKKQLLTEIIQQNKSHSEVYVTAVEGTEYSGKTTLIEETSTMLLETEAIYCDWDFLDEDIPNIERNLSKNDIINLPSYIRAGYLRYLRERMVADILEESQDVLIDRYFLSTIVLHDVDDIDWLKEVPHVLPDIWNICLVSREELLFRKENRNPKNSMDDKSVDELLEQQLIFVELAIHLELLDEDFSWDVSFPRRFGEVLSSEEALEFAQNELYNDQETRAGVSITEMTESIQGISELMKKWDTLISTRRMLVDKKSELLAKHIECEKYIGEILFLKLGATEDVLDYLSVDEFISTMEYMNNGEMIEVVEREISKIDEELSTIE